MKKFLITLLVVLVIPFQSAFACPYEEYDPLSIKCVEHEFTITLPMEPGLEHKVLMLQLHYGDGWISKMINWFYNLTFLFSDEVKNEY